MSVRSYLDHNATSPLRPEARAAMVAVLDVAGNPSSIHSEGRKARAIVESARETVARIFAVKPEAVTFTSGGTEAANWLLQPKERTWLAASPVEHPCVLQGHRFDTSVSIPVNASGIVDLDVLERILTSPAVVAVQAANNETGVLQPVSDVGSLTKIKNGFLVCDAVQTVGRLPAKLLAGADALFFSGHKFGGPKGVGAVVWQSAEPLPPALIRGGGQERRQRSGTENVAAIAGLAAALDAAGKEQVIWQSRAAALQLRLEKGLRDIASHVVIFGEGATRLPNTTLFAIPGTSAQTLLIALDLEGIAVSSGSACSSGKVERSHVLVAMGAPPNLSAGAIRLSTGWNTREDDIEQFLTALRKINKSRSLRAA